MITQDQGKQVQWKECFLQTPCFDKTKSYKTLEDLARSCIDLTNKDIDFPARIAKYRASACGWKYLYAFERVDDQIVNALFDLAKERKVLEQMNAMQDGFPINFIEGFESENRAVLHTAQRDIFGPISPNEHVAKAQRQARDENKKLESFLQSIDKKFDDMIFVGIGGSELGPRALFQSLAFYQNPNKRVHFIGNVDPDDVAIVLKKVQLKRALVVVISKSGTTLETQTNEEFLRDAYRKNGLNPNDHFVSVTMPKTPMDDKSKYFECFYLEDYVGGRYSATSMVGGVLLGFSCGYDAFKEILKGAHEMDKVARSEDVKNNIPLICALIGIWNRNFLKYPTCAVIPYSRVLSRFPAHLQQCDMESNGKQIDRKGNRVSFHTGPIIWGEPGTNAQHSFFQLLHQGTDTVPLELIGCVESQGGVDFEWKQTTSQQKLLSNFFAQGLALATGRKNDNPNKTFLGNRPSSFLLTQKLNAYALGALLSFYENKIAYQGFIWGINSFDQEGVQLGKVLADQFLTLFEDSTEKPFQEGAALIDILKD